MKRLFLICGLVAVLGSGLLFTSGLAGEKLPKLMVMGTMPAGTLVGIQGTGISNIVSKYSPIRVKVKSVTSEVVWVPMLLTGEVDLGVAETVTMRNAYVGRGVYREIVKKLGVKSFPIRLVACGTPIRFSFLVQGEKPFTKISDLKGKTLVWYAKNTAFDLNTRALLANGGLNEKDVRKFPKANPVEAVRAVMDGSADACMVAVDAPVIAEAVATVHARWLPVDPAPEATKRMQSVIPTAYVDTCPGGEHVGVPKDEKFMSLDVYLIGSARASEASIYEITKVLWEHDGELVKRPMLREWVTGRFVSKRAGVPYHPGAIKFYKEQGLWGKEMTELQKKLLAESPRP